MKENDTSRLAREVEAQEIGGHDTTRLPVGTLVTVVMVYGDPAFPDAYEVEAYVEKTDSYHLATVEASSLN